MRPKRAYVDFPELAMLPKLHVGMFAGLRRKYPRSKRLIPSTGQRACSLDI